METQPDKGKLLTLTQAAELLGLNRRTVEIWVDQKAIPSVDLTQTMNPTAHGRRVLRIRRANLLSFIDKSTIKSLER